jgi:simple sugar transport system ATP-binding protein
LEQALVPGLTLTEHFILSEGMGGIFIDHKRALELAQRRIELYNIKGRPESPVESLSGGNQQRALLALLRDSLKLILVEHPTRGLDIESTVYIWSKLKERCAQGTAIVFISSDLDEILQYSDRVIVFFAGRVTPPLDAARLTVERLGRLIGGKDWESIEAEVAHA